tara:strand:- start:9983 stop:10729 length:747 start_codon:yes stop_codon:yes gene_type:complete
MLIPLWKPTSTNQVISHLSYPANNKDTTTLVPGPWRKPFPLKHYRRQLQSNHSSKSKSNAKLYLLNTPGGEIKDTTGVCDNDDNSVHVIKSNISNLPEPCLGTYSSDDNRCLGGTTSITISGSATMNESQYHSSEQYLESKCLTFSQKNKRISNCDSTCPTIYNPSNNQYNRQGGVSSSSRLARLKYATLTRNGAYFKSANGTKKINKGAYSNSGVNNNIRYNTSKCENHVIKGYVKNGTRLAHENCI